MADQEVVLRLDGLDKTFTSARGLLSRGSTTHAVDDVDLEVRRGRAPVVLGRVPPVLLAECCADFAALAALGRPDPHWRPSAGDDRA